MTGAEVTLFEQFNDRHGQLAVDDIVTSTGKCAIARSGVANVTIELDMHISIPVYAIEVLSRSDCCCK